MTTQDTSKAGLSATVIVEAETEQCCSRAIEQLLIGFANGNLE